MSKYSAHTYSRVYRVRKNMITIRVASRSIIKYAWHRIRGSRARRRGDSYEYNDVNAINGR